MPTIEDVAKEAGVSTATVSRVLNNSANVSENTKLKVWKAIRKTGYTPKESAQVLARYKRTYKVAVCISERIQKLFQQDDIGQFYGVIIEAIKRYSNTCGLIPEIKLMETVENEYDGYILIGADADLEMLKRFKSMKKPFVLVDHYIPGQAIDSIVSDGYDGAYYAVSYLIKKGLTRIVHIHASLRAYGFRNRYDGYLAAMEHAGLMPKTYEYDDIANNMSSVIEMMLRTYGLPHAIFASNDIAAIRIINEFKRRNVKIPEDISVIGFDDIAWAETFDPPLTTLRVFKDEMGAFACNRLRDLIMGIKPHPVRISLFTKFIKRKSSI